MVDFPMPGDPPISTSEPATMPPPSTRSNSSIPDEVRASSCDSISLYETGEDDRKPKAGIPPAACPATRNRSSTIVFHSPQSVHCPAHLRDWLPQFWQTNMVAG